MVPYTDQFSVGFERALTRDFSVSVDYVHAFGRDQFMSRDLNPGVRGTPPARAGRARRPQLHGLRAARVNAGRTDYDALQLGREALVEQLPLPRLLHLSKGRGNTSGAASP